MNNRFLDRIKVAGKEDEKVAWTRPWTGEDERKGEGDAKWMDWSEWVIILQELIVHLGKQPSTDRDSPTPSWLASSRSLRRRKKKLKYWLRNFTGTDLPTGSRTMYDPGTNVSTVNPRGMQNMDYINPWRYPILDGPPFRWTSLRNYWNLRARSKL